MGEDEAMQCNCGRIVSCGSWEDEHCHKKQVTADGGTDFQWDVGIRCKINGRNSTVERTFMGLEWAFSGLDVEFWVELQESQDQKHVGGGQITT